MIETPLPGAPELRHRSSFGAGSEAGSRVAERLLTVVATCRQQGQRWLDLLVAAADAVRSRMPAPSLLPAPWAD